MRPDLNEIRETYAANVRRDAWRARLLHEELAEKSAQRRDTAKMRWAFAAGVVIGAVGSYVTHF